MITKDGNNVPILDLTPENYLVPKGEEMVYHCRIEVVSFNQKTGQRTSKPRIQKFGRKAFEKSVRDSLLKQGYKVDVLYNPTEWIKARLDARSVSRAQAKAKKEADIQKRIDEAVAKALAEQKKATKPKTEKKAKETKEATK